MADIGINHEIRHFVRVHFFLGRGRCSGDWESLNAEGMTYYRKRGLHPSG